MADHDLANFERSTFTHAGTTRDIFRLAEMVEACRGVFGSDPLFVSEIGPVLGAHVGPGMLGVGGITTSALS